MIITEFFMLEVYLLVQSCCIWNDLKLLYRVVGSQFGCKLIFNELKSFSR